jgi:hypothetical protein
LKRVVGQAQKETLITHNTPLFLEGKSRNFDICEINQLYFYFSPIKIQTNPFKIQTNSRFMTIDLDSTIIESRSIFL